MNNNLRRFYFFDSGDCFMVAYEPFKKNPTDRWEQCSLHGDVRAELEKTLEEQEIKVYKDMKGFVSKTDAKKLKPILENKGWVYERIEI